MEQLTKQEIRVSHLISQGLIEKEIAEKLYVSRHTIHTHYRNIRNKWGAKNIADITRMYILSLPQASDVLKTICVSVFLMLQVHIIFYDADMDLRRVKRVKTNKIVRVKRKKE